MPSQTSILPKSSDFFVETTKVEERAMEESIIPGWQLVGPEGKVDDREPLRTLTRSSLPSSGLIVIHSSTANT